MSNFNKFGMLDQRANDASNDVSSYHRWSGLVRYYVRENALCRTGADFDAKTRRIRRVALPDADGDAVNKLYVEESVKVLMDRLSKLEASLQQPHATTAAINNDLILLRNSILLLRDDVERDERKLAAIENAQLETSAQLTEYQEAFNTYKNSHGHT